MLNNKVSIDDVFKVTSIWFKQSSKMNKNLVRNLDFRTPYLLWDPLVWTQKGLEYKWQSWWRAECWMKTWVYFFVIICVQYLYNRSSIWPKRLESFVITFFCSTTKTWFSEPRFSEILDLMNKPQLPFSYFTLYPDLI